MHCFYTIKGQRHVLDCKVGTKQNEYYLEAVSMHNTWCLQVLHVLGFLIMVMKGEFNEKKTEHDIIITMYMQIVCNDRFENFINVLHYFFPLETLIITKQQKTKNITKIRVVSNPGRDQTRNDFKKALHMAFGVKFWTTECFESKQKGFFCHMKYSATN